MQSRRRLDRENPILRLKMLARKRYTAVCCKHIIAADAYRAILGTDEIHCLRSLILEAIAERMYRHS